MLNIKNLHVKLEDEDKVILRGVDLTVGAGEVHAIMGPNGSGKSTLSYVLSGRGGYQVTEGSATLDGQELLDMEPPRDWNGLLRLGRRTREKGQWLAIGLKGVHSLMTFFTLMANLGAPCASERRHDFADRGMARQALGLMRECRASDRRQDRRPSRDGRPSVGDEVGDVRALGGAVVGLREDHPVGRGLLPVVQALQREG